MYRDLREWMQQVEELGELRVVRGAHWHLEIGALTEVAYQQPNGGPMLLFDDIVDYPTGYRVVTNTVGSVNRLASALGLPMGMSKLEAADAWHELYQNLKPIPPLMVDDGPIFENIIEESDVDLLKFPTPYWHQGDGGRFIGTGCAVITKDPDSDWVNLGTYRIMIHDEQNLFVYISPGKQGIIHRNKYWEQGKPCPCVISFGHDPSIYMVAGLEVPPGMDEYDVCGGLKKQPIEVVKSPIYGLPIPAYAEIVVEGEIYPDRTAEEGPFGEWTGYFGSSSRQEPLMKVKALYHRNNPILYGTTHSIPPTEPIVYRAIMRSGLVKEALIKAGVPDVRGVWCHEVGGTRLFLAVSIKQRYPGHAKQAAAVALQAQAGAYLGRYVVVVDEDIDVSDLNQVVWAMCTRSEPAESIDILRRCWSGPLDPRIPAERKGFSSRAIIDATKPYEWKDEYPEVCAASPELKKRVAEKWADVFQTTAAPAEVAQGA